MDRRKIARRGVADGELHVIRIQRQLAYGRDPAIAGVRVIKIVPRLRERGQRREMRYRDRMVDTGAVSAMRPGPRNPVPEPIRKSLRTPLRSAREAGVGSDSSRLHPVLLCIAKPQRRAYVPATRAQLTFRFR